MSNGWSRPVALVLLRRSEHVLFVGLLMLGVAGAWRTGSRHWVLAAGAVGVASWYLVGMLLARRSRARWQAAGWLVVLTAGCAALAVGSVSFVWLAFPLFLLYTQLLPLAASVPAVALATVGTIAAIALDRGRLDAPAVVGPLVGAAIAVVITVVYRDLAEQVRQRAELIDELTAARDQLAAAERRAGVLAERERLAREIHDTITQSLTGIVLVLRTARDTDPAQVPALHAQLDTAITAARAALTDTRRLVRALTPAELASRSLPEALGRIVADQPGAGTRLHVEGEPVGLPTPVAVTLLRGAQEALANVRAHARARRVEVTLTFLPEAISLDVVDDGIGFDPALPVGPSTGTGLGLAGLRARAAEVGGSIEVDSAPGRGTALNLTVPRGEATDV
ncbi:sensor histidine kinase [Dactylosporangium sp. AC04546]|uniref:sensor histidine kinase n=1 Tax=Dactylosporangium sp. AC04546 TaxID=2862460 RepID=UPI001EE1158C|nr:sensor histidine kinase [Dactylosporangium sp. AC04546]WVK82348.1 sensor histidine kinase [Dactylosporangium sp. AC04546]